MSKEHKSNGYFLLKSIIWVTFVYFGGAILISFLLGEGTSSLGFVAWIMVHSIVLILYKKYPPPPEKEIFTITWGLSSLMGIPAGAFFVFALLFSSWKCWYIFLLFLTLTILTSIVFWKQWRSSKSKDRLSKVRTDA